MLLSPSEIRGRREDRVAACTRGPRAKNCAKSALTTGTGGYTPAFPARWFYGLYVVSPVNLLDCHRRSRNISRKLSACMGAPGPHDFAVRKKCRSSVGTITSTAFPLHVRDDAYAPLVGAECASVNTISENKK